MAILDSVEVARSCGLHLRQKGSRFWACCPFHDEKTPSLCFFPDGRWHCFGCGKHGDAADLYAELKGVPLGVALKAVGKEDLKQTSVNNRITGAELKRRVDEWKGKVWSGACLTIHMAEALSQRDGVPDERRWQLLEAKAKANDLLNLLETAEPAVLVRLYLRYVKEGQDELGQHHG